MSQELPTGQEHLKHFKLIRTSPCKPFLADNMRKMNWCNTFLQTTRSHLGKPSLVFPNFWLMIDSSCSHYSIFNMIMRQHVIQKLSLCHRWLHLLFTQIVFNNMFNTNNIAGHISPCVAAVLSEMNRSSRVKHTNQILFRLNKDICTNYVFYWS